MKRQFNETPFETSERTAGCETHGHSSLLLHALVIKMPAQCASETMPWHDTHLKCFGVEEARSSATCMSLESSKQYISYSVFAYD